MSKYFNDKGCCQCEYTGPAKPISKNGAGDCQRTEWTKSKISKGIYLSLKSATSIWYYQ
jgi:hypothetical protein